MTQQFNDETSDETPEGTRVVKIPCEVWSRTVGYLRPVQNWHEGKKLEFKDRKTYDLGKSLVRHKEE